MIILTSFPNPEYLYRAVSMGAAGFLNKDTEPDQIARAIHTVIGGESFIDRQLLRDSLKALNTETRSGPTRKRQMDMPSLTERETHILTLIAEGFTNTDIAEVFFVSPNTVKTHVRHIFVKLCVLDRTQAAIWAIRRGIVA